MEPVSRKLAAILSADVAGYSRLMADDHEATLATLTAYRDLFSRFIGEHRGRIVNAPGDAVLAEFGSVVDALACAAEIQRELAEKNAELPGHRKMEFRIGVNLGDVLLKDGALYGDGVNIAARLEALAEPGGICISGTAFDQVEGRLPLEYADLGEQQVKNIPKPVRAYNVLSLPGAAAHRVVRARLALGRHWRRWVLAAALAAALVVSGTIGSWWWLQRQPPVAGMGSSDRASSPLPDQPSLAVLPFVNMSGDPEQEWFVDGLTETLITDLSKVHNLLVVARNSVFSYKGRAVDVRQAGKELRVRHVLEGSVQRSPGRIRVNVQLTDTATGQHRWADRYDLDDKQVFEFQDEITENVVSALNVKLVTGEDTMLRDRETRNIDAYNTVLRGREYFFRFTKEGNERARELFQKAIALDPHYALAYVHIAASYDMEAKNGWGKTRAESVRSGLRAVAEAIALNPNLSEAHVQLGTLKISENQFEDAIGHFNRAVDLRPNDARAHAHLGAALTYTGRSEEALAHIQMAIHVTPFAPPYMHAYLGHTYLILERYGEAIESFNKANELDSKNLFPEVLLVSAYMASGKAEEARLQAARVLTLNPKFSVAQFAQSRLLHKDRAVAQRIEGQLRAAGLQ